MPTWVYILRLQSGTLYIGTTADLDRRFLEHQRGFGSRTTHFDPPDAIVYTEISQSLVSARRRESQLKRWSRAKKEALIRGDLEELKRLAKRRGTIKPIDSPHHRLLRWGESALGKASGFTCLPAGRGVRLQRGRP